MSHLKETWRPAWDPSAAQNAREVARAAAYLGVMWPIHLGYIMPDNPWHPKYAGGIDDACFPKIIPAPAVAAGPAHLIFARQRPSRSLSEILWHELVHARQVETWGSLRLLMNEYAPRYIRSAAPYREVPIEAEAYAISDNPPFYLDIV